MKALVIYDSVFGNTEKIAKAIGEGISAQVVQVSAVKPDDLAGVELLLVGSPTRGFRPTDGMKKFLKDLPSGSLKGVNVGGFDTRMDVDEVDNKVLTFMEKIFGYAAEPIAKVLVQKGGRQDHSSRRLYCEGVGGAAPRWGAGARQGVGKRSGNKGRVI